MPMCGSMLKSFNGHHGTTCLEISLCLLAKLQRYLSGDNAYLPCMNQNDRAEPTGKIKGLYLSDSALDAAKLKQP